MRKKRDPETDERRSERMELQARTRLDHALEEGRALDVAVRRSIQQHGP